MKTNDKAPGKKVDLKQSRGALRVGTSGIVVPGNKQSFPLAFQDKSRLSYYASLFNTLELNSTFYKTPMPSTFEKWSQEVPSDFRFTVKLLKDITHVKNLSVDPETIAAFLRTATHLGPGKSCLLIQFPASITSDFIKGVEKVLKIIHQLDKDGAWQKVVEFRHRSWYTKPTLRLLARYQAATVLQDMPRSNNLDAIVDGPVGYFRFHGPKGDYRGSYDETFLKEQANKIQLLLQGGRDVYVYFNNTMGDAFNNAMLLKRLVDGDAGS